MRFLPLTYLQKSIEFIYLRGEALGALCYAATQITITGLSLVNNYTPQKGEKRAQTCDNEPFPRLFWGQLPHFRSVLLVKAKVLAR